MAAAWISDPEVPKRIAAALVLRGKKSADVAPELNISARTVDRIISGERQPREWEVHQLSQVLDIPLWFFIEGLAGAERLTEDDRLARMEILLNELDRRLALMLDMPAGADPLLGVEPLRSDAT